MNEYEVTVTYRGKIKIKAENEKDITNVLKKTSMRINEVSSLRKVKLLRKDVE